MVLVGGRYKVLYTYVMLCCFFRKQHYFPMFPMKVLTISLSTVQKYRDFKIGSLISARAHSCIFLVRATADSMNLINK